MSGHNRIQSSINLIQELSERDTSGSILWSEWSCKVRAYFGKMNS